MGRAEIQAVIAADSAEDVLLRNQCKPPFNYDGRMWITTNVVHDQVGGVICWCMEVTTATEGGWIPTCLPANGWENRIVTGPDGMVWKIGVERLRLVFSVVRKEQDEVQEEAAQVKQLPLF